MFSFIRALCDALVFIANVSHRIDNSCQFSEKDGKVYFRHFFPFRRTSPVSRVAYPYYLLKANSAAASALDLFFSLQFQTSILYCLIHKTLVNTFYRIPVTSCNLMHRDCIGMQKRDNELIHAARSLILI